VDLYRGAEASQGPVSTRLWDIVESLCRQNANRNENHHDEKLGGRRFLQPTTRLEVNEYLPARKTAGTLDVAVILYYAAA